MAAQVHDSATNEDVMELSGRHAATYWLFSHLEGLRHVPVPETALFDSEGVLEAWMVTDASKKSAKNQDSECQVLRREFLETNVLRLEVHLQDLARERHSEVVAVQLNDTPVYLDESDLDSFIRMLCSREIAMNAAEPDLSIPREFSESEGGGNFCIQEFVNPSRDKHIVVRFQHASLLISRTPDDERDDEEGVRRMTEASSDLYDGRYSFIARDWMSNTPQPTRDCDDSVSDSSVDIKLQARTQQLVQHLVTHLHVFFGLRSLNLMLEFAYEQRRNRLYLVGAQSIKVQTISHTRSYQNQHPTTSATLMKKNRNGSKSKRLKHTSKISTNQFHSSSISPRRTTDELTSQLEKLQQQQQQQQQPPPTHANYRVCRQCRANADVDLAKELMKKQTLLRGILAKYQSVQEQNAAMEKSNVESQELLERQHQTISELQRELDRLRAVSKEQDVRSLKLKHENSSLQTQLADAVDEIQTINSKLEIAEERVLQAAALQTQAASLENDDTKHKIRDWEMKNAHLEAQFEQLQRELERNQQTLRKLQIKYEEVRADRDELRFQWRFVCRKLVDIKEPGVAPPQRIAGGYRSYPTPSDGSVRDVVKWLVDYDAKRILIEAQKKKTSSVGKRLKLELMRSLGSPKKRKSTAAVTGGSGVGSTSPSPRRKSRSPSKWSPTRLRSSQFGINPSSLSSESLLARSLGGRLRSRAIGMTLVEEAILARRE